MPCYFPLQATFSVRLDGKKDIKFSSTNARLFSKGIKPFGDNNLSLPCGRCMGCRLEKSRQWAMRCVHEASLYEDNCFVTLTFASEHLPEDGSLHKKFVQDFMKRLRRKFEDRKIRVFYCGEYGDKLGRPHFHLCLFNLDFADKVKWKKVNDFWYYTSGVLSELWPLGHSTVCDFSFETAAYVARYCTKKVNGRQAEEHYRKCDPETGEVIQLTPEFAGMSLKPGIGKDWLDKFGKTDVFPYDEVIVRGARCKPPRYYDILREREDPVGFAKAKETRQEIGESRADDNSCRRLAQKLKCQEARFKLLIRKMEY